MKIRDFLLQGLSMTSCSNTATHAPLVLAQTVDQMGLSKPTFHLNDFRVSVK
jgi:hypothetical protein